MLISLADVVSSPGSVLAPVGSGAWTGYAQRLVLVEGPLPPQGVDQALVVLSAAAAPAREVPAGIAAAAALVVVGDDVLAEEIAGRASVPVAVPKPGAPAGLMETWVRLNDRAAASAGRWGGAPMGFVKEFGLRSCGLAGSMAGCRICCGMTSGTSSTLT